MYILILKSIFTGMKRKAGLLMLLLLLSVVSGIFAQKKISGKVIDKSNRQSLAFVTIVEKGTTNGTLTDIDGKFSLTVKTSEEKATLICTYLGYKKNSIEIETNSIKDVVIQLENEGVNLNEVVIKPGINPALRIIRKASANRDLNNPEKMHSFSYTSYNKMFVTADLNANEDSVTGYEEGDKDKLSKFFAKQHLFLTESVSKRDYLIPGNNNEKVIASRVSGFKSAPFTLLATQMQSFSFYDDWITVFDINYLNPIADIAINKYSYTLEDTLFQDKDTVYIISYVPKKNKNFSGLKGVIYINTNTFAVQNVIAEPNAEDKQVSIKIQQKYEYIEGKQWFPVQLNTDWIYKNISVKADGTGSNMKAVSRSYIREITLNPELSKKLFNEVVISIDKNSDRQDDEFWNKYRVDSLNKKDIETYRVVDSVGKKENFDKKILALEALLTGQVPLGYVNLDINELIAYNDYEGYRLGLSLKTNHKVSERFSVGGYFAYGFRDKAWKYGGSGDLTLWKKKELKWEILYKHDVLETAGLIVGEKPHGLNNLEVIRNLTITMKDRYELLQSGFSFRALKYFKIQPYLNHQERISPVAFLTYENGFAHEEDTFHINETGIKIKFLFKEKFMQTLRNKISLGSDYPVVYASLAQGMKTNLGTLKGDWEYTKAELKVNYTYKVSTYGKQNICVVGAKVFGNVPYTIQYNGLGNNLYKLGAAAEHCFETMYPNEFVSSEFAALFFSHNFGKFLKPSKSFNPELEIVHNMGIGRAKNTDQLLYFPYKTMEKGFFESGLKINCILKSGISGIGVGAFYRYGPNSFSIPSKNLVVKLTLGLSLI